MRTFIPLLFGAATLAAAYDGGIVSSSTKETSTVFNGKKVPPMLELTPDNWEEEHTASRWLMVKHFSPYCPHCIDFAPTYQTLYEYYYTSTPEGKSDGNFTRFYDFRFASINCIAYYDLCSEHGVTSYPTTTLYENGKLAETFKGGKDIMALGKGVEAALEKTKPGTRPEVQKYPKPGDKSFEGPSADKTDKSAGSKTKAASSEETGVDASATAKAAVSTKGASSKHRVPTKKPKTPVTPNLDGNSTKLTAEEFQSQVTLTEDPWFIKFYAPWCHHCQALAPIWSQLARSMQGKMNIGEVNCDQEARLCKDVRLKGYPTILFFRGGERVEYQGLRGLGDLVHYASKAVEISAGVKEVDAAALEELEKKEEVVFVYFYDHATTSEDFQALERLPLSLIGHAKLVKTSDPKLCERFKITTWPRLLVARDGRPTYYNPLTPREMRDTHMVLNWMKSVWLPIVPELTAANAREIMDGKLVVLGILNRDNQEAFLGGVREIKRAANEWMDKQIQKFQLERQELRDAKQMRIEEAEDRGDQRALRSAKNIRINMEKSDTKEVGFAWVDGIFWQRWIRTTYGIDVKDGERVIINDEDYRRYWDQTITGNYIMPSRTSILETLNKVTQSPPKIKAKSTISSLEKIFFDIRITFAEHTFVAIGVVLAVALGAISWYRGRLRRTRGGHFRLGDDGPAMKEFRGPLLGGNVNGKTD